MSDNFERGLWVEAESSQRPLQTRQSVITLVERAKELGTSDLYLQVYRNGRSWFGSQIADEEPFKSCEDDPLKIISELSCRAGMRVHAWLNVFNLGVNSSAKTLGKLGPDVQQIDCCGAPVSSYLADQKEKLGVRGECFQLDTPGLWLDPSSSRVQEFFMEVAAEVGRSYPFLAGIHLDFIRFPYLLPIKPSSGVEPGFEFGYSEHAISSFRDRVGEETPFTESGGVLRPADARLAQLWDDFRRGAVDECVRRVRSVLPTTMQLSVAALPWSDRAYLSAFQNWRMWLEEDLVDKVLLMSYTADMQHFSQMVKQACAFRSNDSKVVAGIGVYKFSEGAELEAQRRISKECGADGYCIFSYGNLKG